MAHGHSRDEYIPPPEMRHETRDFSTRVVVGFGVSLLVAAIAIHVAIWGLYVWLGRASEKAYTREYPLATVGAPVPPPAPRLQTRPREELKEMRAEEDRLLKGYSLADPSGVRVHIPVDRAMKLLLEQGLPARAAGPAGQALMPQDSSSGRTLAPRGK
ncbi:MAG: hypothetical protein EHM13_03685 [Acidobacteria bacterium]|nr:MAG: hypothetical protein EHM13_03685 [Acidobacteriota bacterium]